MDSGADATSVTNDHSYFCSQKQATPKSNTNGSDTTLSKGKCSTTCQTDLTAEEIDYLESELKKCRRKKKILSENVLTKRILRESLTLKT